MIKGSLFIAAKLRLRLPYVLATVVAERFTDLWAVALIGTLLAFLTTDVSVELLSAAAMLAASASAVAAVALLVESGRRARARAPARDRVAASGVYRRSGCAAWVHTSRTAPPWRLP